jgi:DNA replication and repair protein RecF
LLLRRLWLTDFRSFESVDLVLTDGLTGLLGANGQGKTNLLEAIAWIATLRSFRGAPTDALVREGSDRAVIRADVAWSEREVLIEAELTTRGRNRVHVNRQRLARTRDLLGALRVTVFSPDDLALVKGGPGGRRALLDEILVGLHPRHDAIQRDVDRVVQQRNALLRQLAGRVDVDGDAAATLAVWDAKLAAAGETLTAAREELVSVLGPWLSRAHADVAGPNGGAVRVDYRRSWSGDLGAALAAGRTDDLRRQVTQLGPHRDELEITLAGRPARTHASQGEQRSLALAVRLAAHRLVTDSIGTPPVLLLDDVFSELDTDRGDALLTHLPPGQALLTSAAGLPAGARPERVLVLEDGKVREQAP